MAVRHKEVSGQVEAAPSSHRLWPHTPLSHKVSYSFSKLVQLLLHNANLETDCIFLRSLKWDRFAALRTFY